MHTTKKVSITRQWMLFALLLVSLCLRLWKLNQVPPAPTHDELGYIYNSYSISRTGKDVNGVFFPLNFDTQDPKSPVPVYIMALIFTVLPLNIFIARSVFVIASVLVIFLIYQLADALFPRSRIPLLSAFSLTLMPWHFQISRLAYDGVLAVTFYLLGIVLVITKNNYLSKVRCFFAFVAFLMGYFSYHGAKVWFYPLILLLIWFIYKKKMFNTEVKVFFTSLLLVPTILFILIATSSNVNKRWQDTTVFSVNEAATAVNFERRTSSAPQIVQKVFNNKASYFVNKIIKGYLSVFSTDFLFTNGESSPIYSVWGRGQLYLIDLVFLLLGLFEVFKKQKKEYWFVLGLMLISPTATAITTQGGTSMRALLAMIPISLLVAMGVDVTVKRLLPRIKVTTKIIFYVFLMVIFSLGYFYQYFYRYPIYSARALLEDERQIVGLVSNTSDNFSQILIGPRDSHILWEFAYYQQIQPERFQAIWGDYRSQKDELSLDQKTILFLEQEVFENRVNESTEPAALILTSFNNPQIKTNFVLIDPFDSATLWKGWVNNEYLPFVLENCSWCKTD